MSPVNWQKFIDVWEVHIASMFTVAFPGIFFGVEGFNKFS
jgi:hypothetical protein